MAVGHWVAMQFSKVMEAGRTRPVILRCSPADHADSPATNDFVTKAMGCPEIHKEKLFAELFGSLLARKLGLHVPAPGIIQIGKELANVVNSIEEVRSAGIRLAQGQAFGSALVLGLHATAGLAPSTDQELVDAASIFAFDMITQNSDRQSTRLNAARDGEHLLAFDFESCFGFLYDIGPSPSPLDLSRLLVQRHGFWKVLRGRLELMDPLMGRLAMLTDEELDDMAAEAPREWQTHRVRIIDHIKAVRNELPSLRTELRRLLT